MKKNLVAIIFLSVFFSACSSSNKKNELDKIQVSKTSIVENEINNNFINDSLNSFISEKINNISQNTENRKKLKETASFMHGEVIDKTNLDGCTFIILINDSIALEPVNLDNKFKKNKLQIIFKYRESRAMTTCMIGQAIIISEAREYKTK